MKKLVSLAGLAAVMSLVVVALAPAAQRAGKYTVNASLNSRQETPRPKRAVTARGSFTRHVRREQDGRRPEVEADVHAADRLSDGRAHPQRQAGRRRPGDRAALRPLQEWPMGTTKISKAVVATLEKNGAYVNVHTAKNAGGEIRGQVSVKED